MASVFDFYTILPFWFWSIEKLKCGTSVYRPKCYPHYIDTDTYTVFNMQFSISKQKICKIDKTKNALESFAIAYSMGTFIFFTIYNIIFFTYTLMSTNITEKKKQKKTQQQINKWIKTKPNEVYQFRMPFRVDSNSIM